ncbi:MAG: 2-hydroxyacyl-CoA dehydratase family protein [Spirochaetota bacterium]|nr:2-hydroxyacyl-CoA dehydratase family protein [Spirochaetota bacterium]
MTTKVTAPGKKNLETTLEISKAIRAYYGGLKVAKENGIPIIWSFGLVPREIFHAAEAPVLYLEHLPLMMGAKQLSGHYIQIAEEDGVSRDVCAFHRCFLGCAVAEEREAYLDNFFVPPDLIIASNLPCMSESKSFHYARNKYDVPYYEIDAPINSWGTDAPDYAIQYYADQLNGAISFMNDNGFNITTDKLVEAVTYAKELVLLWNKIDDCRKAVPTPITSVDGLTAAYPLIQLSGTKLGVTLFQRLLSELEDKVANGVSAIENEKLRLMWYGVPPFYNMGLLNYVEQYGAVVVKSMVEYIAGGAYDPEIIVPDKPLESLATKALIDIINPTYENMVNFIVKATEEFKIDGLVGVVKRTCGLLPGYMRLVKDEIYNKLGVPTTIFDLDGLDIREYDDVISKSNLDSFIESLLARKGGN